MNTKHISLAALAIVAVLTGCTKNPIEAPSDSKGLADLELTSVNSVQTKAAIDGTTFPTEGEIGLFLFKDETATQAYGDGYENIKYTYNSTKGKWTASPSIKVGSDSGYLFGYYPYNSASTDVKAIPVASSLNGDDVMYAEKVSNVTDATASQTAITMNHALARVSITVKNNGYTGDAELTKIKFYGAEIAQGGTLNALDGKITAEKDEVSLDVTGDAQTITAAGTTYECLLVPSGENDNKQTVTLTLTIDGEDKTATLSGENGVIIAQGTKSNITITLSNSGISVQTVSVEDWNVVEVGGHKVTISVADGIDPNDILTKAYVDGNNVIIKASSFQCKGLVCNVGDKAKCERVVTNGKFTFTISEISSDIEAVLGYDPIVKLTVSSNSGGMVYIGTDREKKSGQYEFGEQVVIHAEAYENFIFYWWNDNNKESDRTITVGATDVTYYASFIHKDAILSIFTVNSNGKQVFFSKGNLYYNGTTFNFEANQYDTTPSGDGKRDNNHISHFMWCDNAANAMALNYNVEWDGVNKSFFATKYFIVNGYGGWSVLTGGPGGEWWYLLDKRNTKYGENRRYAMVKVNDMPGLLIFPDDFSSWPSKDAGTEPQIFNTNSSSWNDRNYTVEQFTVLQNNGCVFLPAAGCRDGDDYSTAIMYAGSDGYYWSASMFDDYKVFALGFKSDLVQPKLNDNRAHAYSVRLVTDAN